MNNQKFCDFVLSRGIKKDWLSEKLGISRTALNYKLNGTRPFRLEEIKTIRKETRMSDEELITIFFD